jgi:hypothetical protein
MKAHSLSRRSVMAGFLSISAVHAFPATDREIAPAPLFRDPIFDGAADPVVIWNRQDQCWWLLYTQRRANVDVPGVAWCHGCDIGVARSRDNGHSWRYLGVLPVWSLNAAATPSGRRKFCGTTEPITCT